MIRIRPWLLALAIMAATAADRSAHTEASGPDYFTVSGVAVGDLLNIRAEPSANSAKIGEIPSDGHGIQNLGCEGGPTFAKWQMMGKTERGQAARKRWCRIRYNGVEGWVAGRFLIEDSGPKP